MGSSPDFEPTYRTAQADSGPYSDISRRLSGTTPVSLMCVLERKPRTRYSVTRQLISGRELDRLLRDPT
ncbi:hypothetical protein GOBAR_DD29179 [Gossypium barbadense]|nr:hypothetical protein GOBAR_DD29179 [Gossypium barbadense]